MRIRTALSASLLVAALAVGTAACGSTDTSKDKPSMQETSTPSDKMDDGKMTGGTGDKMGDGKMGDSTGSVMPDDKMTDGKMDDGSAMPDDKMTHGSDNK